MGEHQKKDKMNDPAGQDLFQATFEKSSAPIAILEEDATVSIVNDAFCMLCGYSRDELIGMNWVEKLPIEEQTRLKRYNQMRLNNPHDAPEQYEFSFLNKNGELRYGLMSVTILEEYRKTIATITDITDRKKEEEALAESEYFFKKSQYAAFIGSYKIDFVKRNWESSEVFDKILGIDSHFNRVINDEWQKMIHPDDWEKIKYHITQEVFIQRKPFNAEYRIIRQSDKETRWVHGLGKVITDNHNNIRYMMGTIQDITERKKIEEKHKYDQQKFSMALQIAHLGPWEYDAKNDLFHFNDEFYAVYRTTAEQMGGYIMSSADYIKHFVHPEDRESVTNEIKYMFTLDLSQESLQLEHRMLYANGETGNITVSFVIVRNDQGEIVKTYGINQDITQQKQTEEGLKRSETRLKELNITKDKFFSIIAHDLRTPFFSILGLSEIISTQFNKLTSSQILQLSKALNRTADSAYQLLENLLEWSRIQRGSMPFNPENMEMKELFFEIDESTVEMAKKKKISLTFDFSSVQEIYADKNMLLSILRNLISNAIKFTRENGLITVKTEYLSESEILFSVKDTGIGMDEKIIENLFQLDTNVSRPGTNDEPSTGLGLILCKEFVEKHKGRIWAESTKNAGSTFFFTIMTNNRTP